jgi:hypothetical protein
VASRRHAEESAAEALGKLGRTSDEVVAALLKALGDERNQETVLIEGRPRPVYDVVFDALWTLAGRATGESLL